VKLGGPRLTLNHIQEAVNTYLGSLLEKDDSVRVKDTLPMDETKFSLEIKPIHLLLLQNNLESAYRVIKDSVSFSQLYFKSSAEEANIPNKQDT
jgi:hypothetical protein